jgi:hypothetical protein
MFQTYATEHSTGETPYFPGQPLLFVQTGSKVRPVARFVRVLSISSSIPKTKAERRGTIPGPYKAAMVRKVLRLDKAPAAAKFKDTKSFIAWLKAP